MAKSIRELFNEIEERREEEEFKLIIEKPKLTPEEIWSITPDNFYKWRVKYDYPRILGHFSLKLNGFEDWKKEYGFSNDKLISLGISNCINPNPSKDKKKFIVEKSWNGEKTFFISYKNINGKYYNLGREPVKHKVISNFVGYFDWCIQKKIKIIKGINDSFLTGYEMSHPVGLPHLNSIKILDGLELLKVGGIEVKPDEFGTINPKYFEFVNADYLKFTGKLNTRGLELVFENSHINFLMCENLDLSLVKFNNCSVNNLLSINSVLQQWNFYNCGVSGKVIESDFKWVSINGGYFDIDFKDSTFLNVDAFHSSKKNYAFENAYRVMKNVYAEQGDDKNAIKYFLLEKEIEREKLRSQIFKNEYYGLFKLSWKDRINNNTIHSASKLLNFAFHWINNFYWGYGRKPIRIIGNSLMLILVFAVIYYFGQSMIVLSKLDKSLTFLDSLYYSTVTFTTLGDVNFSPIGAVRIITAIEAFLGGISMGFFVAGFSNFKY